MMLDGEWRVAFLKNEHPEFSIGPRRCRSTRPTKSAYGSG